MECQAGVLTRASDHMPTIWGSARMTREPGVLIPYTRLSNSWVLQRHHSSRPSDSVPAELWSQYKLSESRSVEEKAQPARAMRYVRVLRPGPHNQAAQTISEPASVSLPALFQLLPIFLAHLAGGNVADDLLSGRASGSPRWMPGAE